MTDQWKDTTVYSQRDTERVPRAWTFQIGNTSITIHRHKNYAPDVWLVRCNLLDPQSCVLNAQELEAAKAEALEVVKARIEMQMREFRDALDALDSR